MRERAYKRLQHGERHVPLSDFGRNGDDLVQVLWELNHDVTIGEYPLPNVLYSGEELLLTRLHPVERPKAPEQEHLARNGSRIMPASTIDRFDRDLEAMRITEVREELRQML